MLRRNDGRRREVKVKTKKGRQDREPNSGPLKREATPLSIRPWTIYLYCIIFVKIVEEIILYVEFRNSTYNIISSIILTNMSISNNNKSLDNCILRVLNCVAMTHKTVSVEIFNQYIFSCISCMVFKCVKI